MKQGKIDDDREFNNTRHINVISKNEKWRRDVVVYVVTTL